MIALLMMVAALGASDTAASQMPVKSSMFSDCVLAEIASMEHTTPEKLNSFTKSEANRAFAKCQAVKKEWATSLDAQLSSDPRFVDPVARKAKVNQIISTDELSMMLMVNLKAK